MLEACRIHVSRAIAIAHLGVATRHAPPDGIKGAAGTKKKERKKKGKPREEASSALFSFTKTAEEETGASQNPNPPWAYLQSPSFSPRRIWRNTAGRNQRTVCTGDTTERDGTIMAKTAKADGRDSERNGRRQSHRTHRLRTIKHGIINLFGTHASYSCGLYAPHVLIIDAPKATESNSDAYGFLKYRTRRFRGGHCSTVQEPACVNLDQRASLHARFRSFAYHSASFIWRYALE